MQLPRPGDVPRHLRGRRAGEPRDGSRWEGREALREPYVRQFAQGRCRARITGRLAEGDWVVDREVAEGVAEEPVRAPVAHRVRDGLIERVDFLG
ncbi:hypothetical protein GCM10023235_63030 [Kitasatospora terrestris]|uniref:SnoaL-like domain-containing protein n=1 Tax=Kitasatospora terrestris TaxID=258051 RepID=A0ABP9EDH0_9ACTN